MSASGLAERCRERCAELECPVIDQRRLLQAVCLHASDRRDGTHFAVPPAAQTRLPIRDAFDTRAGWRRWPRRSTPAPRLVAPHAPASRYERAPAAARRGRATSTQAGACPRPCIRLRRRAARRARDLVSPWPRRRLLSTLPPRSLRP